MPETPNPPSPSEKTVVVNNSHLCRLWTLTYISLGLNALILFLLVVGAIIHHHQQQKYHRFGGGGCFEGQSQFGWKHPFHHFGGPGWGPQGGFGGDRFRGGNEGGPRFGGGPGMGGMNGMMSGPMGKPDPAKMTDMILNNLSKKLTLTDDEKGKIKPIIEEQVAEIQKQREAQRAAMQKQIEDAKAKIKPLLTPDQQKQLDAIPLPGQKPAAPDEAKQPAAKAGQ
jgi:Spy/CpxP family protein refolding chaperone